ncbi:MAG: hypothetical protein ACI90V_011980 [Bacillariaceae sp.]|jgi:hypothetical protein
MTEFLLTVLFLDYELSICIGWFAISRCFGYRLVELVSHCRIALQWNTVSHICTVIYGTGLSLLHIC